MILMIAQRHMLLSFAIAIAVAVVCPASGADESQYAAETDVRIIQLDRSVGYAAKSAAEVKAVKPQRLTEADDDMAVYLAPADTAIVLAGHVWQLSTERDDDVLGGPWTRICAPGIISLLGQEARVRVGRQIPYMVKREDGSLVVEHGDKIEDKIEGLILTVMASEVSESSVLLDKLSVELSRVVGREPIPGVPFDVGRPIIRTMAASTSMRLAPDQCVIIEMPTTPDDEPVFVLVQARAKKLTE